MFAKLTRCLAAACVTLSFTMVGCSINPATGKTQFNLMSDAATEIRLGDEAAPQFIDEAGGLVQDAEVCDYVSAIGQKLAAESERKDLPWEFNVVDSATVNAFALPGGKIFITRGLLERMTNEAQLAGVLGHEVGHVTAQHVGQQMSQAMVLNAGLAVLGSYTDDQYIQLLGGTAGQLYLLRFSRTQESEADRLGLRYMTRLNYNPHAMVQVMEILKNSSGGSGMEIFQTHPNPDHRIDDLTKWLSSDYAYTQNNQAYGYWPDRFKTSVLDHLAKLGPPKHNPAAEPQNNASSG